MGVFRKERIATSHPLLIGYIDLSTLTRLEVESIKQNAEIYMNESIVLPNLQEICVRGFGHRDRLAWPTMPRLQRLTIVDNWFWEKHLYLPQGSRDVRILEFVGGWYREFFWTDIRQFAPKLEVLFIMAALSIPDGFPFPTFAMLKHLHICPSVFCPPSTSRIPQFPSSLVSLNIVEVP